MIAVNIELVLGCGNVYCNSFGRNCSPRELQYMSRDVLNNILADCAGVDISEFHVYSRGESVLHPDIALFVSKIREAFPDAIIYNSTDVAMFKRMGYKAYNPFDVLQITHKYPCEITPLPKERGDYAIKHVFITKKIDMGLLVKIDKYLDSVPTHEDIVILPEHNELFGWTAAANESVSEGRKFIYDEDVQKLVSDQEVATDNSAKLRALYTVNGELKNCLVADTKALSLSEHVKLNRPCDNCRIKTSSYIYVERGDKNA